MRKLFTTIAVTIIASTMAQAQLKVTSIGTVGIGTGMINPNAALDLGNARYVKGNPLFLMYNDNNTSPFAGTKMGFYVNNFGDNNLNLVFPEVAAYPGLFTICGKNTSGTTLNPYFSVAGMTGNIGIGIGQAIPAYRLDIQGSVRWGNYGLGSTGWDQVILDWSSNIYGNPALYPKKDGNLYVGLPSNRVQVNAVQVWSVQFTNSSDERIKENITNLSSSLQKIKQLRGVRYDIKEKFLSKKTANLTTTDLRKNNIGFLAQELEKVFPELIVKSDSGLYGVNYIGLIPVLVEAIKEQIATIDNLQDQVSSLSNQLTTLQNCCKSSGSKTKSNVENDNIDILTSQTSTAILYQNSPNPFKQSTTIKLELPQTIVSALVCIYDLNGRQLKCFTVTGRGNTSVQITASELSAGMYHYALIADGNLIDTKTMVLTE